MSTSPLPPRPAPSRKSGTLNLFPAPETGIAAAPADVPYARFRLCRGFIDDLNRILPIRARIRLEGELAQGLMRGELEAPIRFRWEFVEHG